MTNKQWAQLASDCKDMALVARIKPAVDKFSAVWGVRVTVFYNPGHTDDEPWELTAYSADSRPVVERFTSDPVACLASSFKHRVKDAMARDLFAPRYPTPDDLEP